MDNNAETYYTVLTVNWRGERHGGSRLTETEAETRYAEEATDESGNTYVALLRHNVWNRYPSPVKEWKINAEQQGS